MDYLTARWLAVKKLPPQKIKNLHKLERAVFDYGVCCRRAFPSDKTVPPLWWRCADSFLNKELKAVFAALPYEHKKFAADAGAVLSLCKNKKINPADAFNDIGLMHALDELAIRV